MPRASTPVALPRLAFIASETHGGTTAVLGGQCCWPSAGVACEPAKPRWKTGVGEDHLISSLDFRHDVTLESRLRPSWLLRRCNRVSMERVQICSWGTVPRCVGPDVHASKVWWSVIRVFYIIIFISYIIILECYLHCYIVVFACFR